MTEAIEQVAVESEVTKLDPVEVEKALLTDKQKEAINRSPEDVAAALFSMYFPVLKNVLNNKAKMTRKSLIKVMLAAVEVPLNSTEYKLLKKDEREVFSIIASLLEAKWQMMLSTLVSTQQKLADEKAAADAAVPNVTPSEVIDSVIASAETFMEENKGLMQDLANQEVASPANESDLKVQS